MLYLRESHNNATLYGWSRKLREILCTVVVSVSAIATVSGCVSCSEGPSDDTKVEEQTIATQQSLHRLIITARKAPASSAKQKALSRYETARHFLASYPKMPSNEPYLISAVFTIKPNHIQCRWMQRGFGVQGIYLLDKNGRIAKLSAPNVFKNKMRRLYENMFLRVAYIEFRQHGGGTSYQSSGDFPIVTLPQGFVLKNVRLGLIGRNGKTFPAKSVLTLPKSGIGNAVEKKGRE